MVLMHCTNLTLRNDLARSRYWRVRLFEIGASWLVENDSSPMKVHVLG